MCVHKKRVAETEREMALVAYGLAGGSALTSVSLLPSRTAQYSLVPAATSVTVVDTGPHLMLRVDEDKNVAGVGTSQDPAAANSAYLLWCAANTWVQWGWYPVADYLIPNATTSSTIPIPGASLRGAMIYVNSNSDFGTNSPIYMRMVSANGVTDTGSNYRYRVGSTPSSSSTTLNIGYAGGYSWVVNGRSVSSSSLISLLITGFSTATVYPICVTGEYTLYGGYRQLVNGQWHAQGCGVPNNTCTGLNIYMNNGGKFRANSRIRVFGV